MQGNCDARLLETIRAICSAELLAKFKHLTKACSGSIEQFLQNHVENNLLNRENLGSFCK